MIVSLDDFLRRRSKIELLVLRERLRRSAGLFEACEHLFGDQAREKVDDYFKNRDDMIYVSQLPENA